MNILLTLNIVVTLFLCVIWKTSNWLNVLIKLSLVGLWVANGFFLAQSLGYVVKVV